MPNAMKWNSAAVLLTSLLALAGCVHQGRHRPSLGPAVNLEPNDPRPVFSIAVSDDAEAALIRQRLGFEPLRIDGQTLYFHDTPGIREKLAEHGYTPARQSPYSVYQRIVRVEKRGADQELAHFDVTLINRESAYWVVRGSIGALRALSAAGYRLSQLGPDEPRPRQVRIYAPSLADVQRINALFVDIYSVTREGREGKDQRGIIVTGGAFDGQIDDLVKEGFRVETVNAPKKGDRP
ncbi:MAG TPA: hypothetical protein VGK03_09130 [Geothrix sp.]|jgi:hypothetical protein